MTSTASAARPQIGLAVAFSALGIVLRFLHLDADIPTVQNADDLGDEGYWFITARDILKHHRADPGTNFLQGPAGAPLTVATHAMVAMALGTISYGSVRGVTAIYGSLILLLGLAYFLRLERSPTSASIFAALYGLLPLTLLYSRMGHVEQHVLFYLFLAFVLAQHGRRARALIGAGLAFAAAVAVKAVALLVLPAFLIFAWVHHRRARRSLAWMALGAVPIALPYAAYLGVNLDRFAATWSGLAAYPSTTPFINPVSVRYFWAHPLVVPYLPFIAAGMVAAAWLAWRRDRLLHWAHLWMGAVALALSLAHYGSYARHLMFFFPLLLAVASALGKAVETLERSRARTAVRWGLTASLMLAALQSVAHTAREPLWSPRYTLRDAARSLASVTDHSDVAAGPHAHLLSLAGIYQPRFMMKSPGWRQVDPPDRVRPSVLLIPRVWNGVRNSRITALYPTLREYAGHEWLETITYLGRFELGIYRVFQDSLEREAFMRFRRGRPSRYDGLVYNRYRSDPAIGCFVKGLMVAESRGDPEISHKKISPTGCLGMLGFCGATAAQVPFSGIFKRRVARVNPERYDEDIFLRDDRFDPALSIQAAEAYAHNLRSRFGHFTDGLRFSFAAYNAGPNFVQFLLDRSGDADPSWKEVELLLFRPDTRHYHGYERWSQERRDHKFRVEVPLYVADAFGSFDACMRNVPWEVQYPDGPRSRHDETAGVGRTGTAARQHSTLDWQSLVGLRPPAARAHEVLKSAARAFTDRRAGP